MFDQLKRVVKNNLPFAITKNQKYDNQTKAIIKQVCGQYSNCIDIGCHSGEVLDVMLKYAPNGKHFAFEPIPYLFKRLKSKYEGVAVYNLALSNQKSKTTFNLVPNNPEYSGLKKRKYLNANEKVEVIDVETDLLDNIIPSDTKIDLIKIDVEGAELQVLRGAKKVISASKPVVVFEHGLGASDYYGTKPEDVYQLLVEECGMEISLMEQWLKDKPSLSKEDFLYQYNNGLNYYFVASF